MKELQVTAEELHQEKKELVTARKAAEMERLRFRLLVTITQAISEAEDFDSAIGVTLRKLCESTGWDFAEAWIPRPDGTALGCSPAWYGATESLERFRTLSEGLKFSPGVGLPGRVWVSKQPEWTRDVSVEPDNIFPRAEIARNAGLKAALGIPIIASNQVLAVLVFFMLVSRDEDQRLVEIVSAAVTQLGSVIQHKRAEQALRESERRFRAIFDQTFQFVGILSPDGTLLEANQTALDFRGLKRSDVVGRPFWETAWWDISRATQDRLKAAMAEAAQGKFVRYEVEHRDHDGAVGTFDFSLKPVTEEGGKVVLIIAEGRNITGRKRAEQELRESEERYRQLVELSPSAIFLNHEGKFFFVNTATLELFRAASPEQLIGKPVMDFVHPDYRELVNKRIRQTLEHGIQIPLIEQKNIRLDGTELDVEVTAAPLIYQGKQMVQVVARDITERKRTEEALFRAHDELEQRVQERTAELAKANEALKAEIMERTRLQEQLIESERLAAIGATAARLAHEVGNPLNGMFMTAQLLERRLARQREALDETVNSTVRSLMDEITRLSHLVHEFSSLSRREKYNFQPIALATVAGEVFAMEKLNYSARGIHVEQTFPPDLPLVVADRDRLKQALWNLCKNAVEAMPQGGTLALRAYNSEEQIALEITDTGGGIPAGVDIFEPFTTTKSSGTGLGLVIVRQIVAAHGGTIIYNSEPGRGTVFRLTLPVSPSPSAANL